MTTEPTVGPFAPLSPGGPFLPITPCKKAKFKFALSCYCSFSRTHSISSFSWYTFVTFDPSTPLQMTSHGNAEFV